MVVAGTVILGLHRLTGRGNAENLVAWLLASWLIFNTWAAVSTTLSVVVKREHNSMLVFFAAAMVFVAMNFARLFFPDHGLTAVFFRVVRWACPPVKLLGQIGLGQSSLWQNVDGAAHSLMLTALYGLIGIILLSRREFKYAREG
jgi:hypothetical protein